MKHYVLAILGVSRLSVAGYDDRDTAIEFAKALYAKDVYDVVEVRYGGTIVEKLER